MPLFLIRAFIAPTLTLAAHPFLWAGSDSHLGQLPSLFENQSEEPQALTFGLTYSFDHFENLSGGFSTGGTSLGLLDLGFELDLDTLFGWQDTSFSLSAFAPHGNDFSAGKVGDFSVVSNIYADTEFNLFRIQLVKKWKDSESFIKIGQIAADDDFMGTPTAEIFINSAFVPFNTQSGNTASPIFPLAAPGVVLHLNPWENVSFTTGLYAGFSGDENSNNRGFEWELGEENGYAFFLQAAYQYIIDPHFSGDNAFVAGIRSRLTF